MLVRDNALYRLWCITGESAALFSVSLRWLWTHLSAYDVQTILMMGFLLSLSLLLLQKEDPTTLLLHAAAGGIISVLLPWFRAIFLPCVMALTSAGSIRLAVHAPAMGTFCFTVGKPPGSVS
jgi:hypothetical protein